MTDIEQQQINAIKAETLTKAAEYLAPVGTDVPCGDFEQGIQWCVRVLNLQARQLEEGGA